MLKSRKLSHALALVGALTLGSVASYAQGNICSGVMTTTNLGVRPEGLTELSGDVVVNCQPTPGSPGGTILPDQFTVLMQLTSGVDVTNTATTGIGAPAITVAASGNPVPVTSTVAYPSGLPNAVSFGVTGAGTASNSFTINGLRINANKASSAGISQVFATLIVTTVSTGNTTILPLSNNPSLVATILPKSLNFTVIGGNDATEDDAAFDFPTCISNSDISGILRFSENFSNVLRNQAQEGTGAGHATYIRVVFSNVPAGVTILVPNSTFTTGSNGLTPFSGISTTDATGITIGYTPRAGDIPYGPNNPPTVPANGDGGYGAAGTEIVYSVETIAGASNSTATLDTLSIPFIARFSSGPTIGIGTATAKGTFAPIGGDTIPRFADVGDTANAFSTSICATTLLYPYVTTAAGYDTGIAISNTTADPAPLSTPNQSGTCSLNLFGAYDSGATVPGAGTTPTINAGRVYAISLNDSPAFASGARVGPGFTGYLIAQCNFQLAHGFAFVSDYGARNLAMGYLPLILNKNNGSRTSGVADQIERLVH